MACSIRNTIKKCQLKAFTIMELLVVLVLISIVISSGALLYFQFNAYLENNLKQTSGENAVMLFTRAFRNDIDKQGNTIVAGNEIHISGINSPKIQYTFEETFIVRALEQTADTFFVNNTNLIISGNPVTGEFMELSLNLENGNISFPILIRKEPEQIELFNKME